MTETKVKICGLTRPEDVEAAIAAGADMLGFIIEAESPRRLSVKQATRLSRPAFGCAKTVAVTVNASEDLLERIHGEMWPDYIQMHGNETPRWLRVVMGFTGIPIIKSIPVRKRADLEKAHAYAGCADYILLDAKPPKGTKQAGGHGTGFDWSLLKGFRCQTPLILAGGLSPDKAEAARTTGLDFFDVSSGVEAAPGVKDHAKIKAFMKAVKHA